MKIRDLSEKRVATPDFQKSKEVESSMTYRMKLQDQGWDYLGSGSFGTVMGNPVYPNWVLKIFRDPAYLKYLTMSKHSNNPHFPRVGKQYRMWITNSKKYLYACMVEKLDDDTSSLAPYANYFDSNWWVSDRKPDPSKGANMWERARIKEVLRIDQTWPKFKEACREIVKMVQLSARNRPDRAMLPDVNTRNMMMRGDCPVFSDPIYEPTQQWDRRIAA